MNWIYSRNTSCRGAVARGATEYVESYVCYGQEHEGRLFGGERGNI
jgi:hypothetical protein